MMIYDSIVNKFVAKEVTMKLTEKQILALKRKRGEENLSIKELAKQVGVSRWTISRIIKSQPNLSSTTIEKVKDWLIDQYTTIK